MRRMMDIQEKINEAVRKQAKTDWQSALSKAGEILKPFVVNGNSQRSEIENLLKEIGGKSIYGNNSQLYFGYEMEVPESYVKFKQDKASEEFIQKVNELQSQIDELSEQMR